MESLWVLRLVHCKQIRSCVRLRNDWLSSRFYRRFVDYTITKQSSVKSAIEFLSTLNNCHPSLQFTMEIEVEGKLPFLGAELIRKDHRLKMKVYIKPTNTGLLHFDSNVDMNYKKALVLTMLNLAFLLSSAWKYFTGECERLREVFLIFRFIFYIYIIDTPLKGLFSDKFTL